MVFAVIFFDTGNIQPQIDTLLEKHARAIEAEKKSTKKLHHLQNFHAKLILLSLAKKWGTFIGNPQENSAKLQQICVEVMELLTNLVSFSLSI